MPRTAVPALQEERTRHHLLQRPGERSDDSRPHWRRVAVAKEEVVETDDESAVGFKVEYEAFTTVEDGADECLL